VITHIIFVAKRRKSREAAAMNRMAVAADVAVAGNNGGRALLPAA
jgi:hypothetical protein